MTCEEDKKSGCCAKWLQILSVILRVAVVALAAAAAAIMATASQCTVYSEYGWGWRPRIISYSDFPAFVYLVAAATIAALLEAIAVFLSLCKKCKKVARVLMPLLGAIAPALLYSAAGAAFAAGWDIYFYLEPSGRRFSLCQSSVAGGRFCERVHVAMWLVLGAALAVSIAELLTALQTGVCGEHVSSWLCSCCCGSDSGSDSDSDSDAACGHGCHCKH